MVDTEVRVVNNLGEDVTPNGLEQGEIIVKGHGVINNDGQETVDGWLRTGDIGTIDKDGSIKIIEPKKDISTTNGTLASSVEIENILIKHPAILEVAVIATPHMEHGEILHAFVVLNEKEEITKQELIDFSSNKLAQPNQVNKITFLDELPRTTSGKILKGQLNELHNNNSDVEI